MNFLGLEHLFRKGEEPFDNICGSKSAYPGFPEELYIGAGYIIHI
jgi:hypothetical protein